MASYQVNPLEILDTTNSTGVGSGGSLTVGGGVSIGKDTHIGGNITVSGTSASFSDNIIVLNSGATTSQDTGLLLERASTDVSGGNNYSALVYSESADEFRFGYATSDTRGTITLNSYVPIRTGGVYAGDSQIDNISVGNLNFNTLYQNGVPYIGSSQWTTTSGNTLTYTSGNVILSQQLSANNNSNTLGNIFTTNGNVGINTTTPSNTLDVSGTANITTSITTGALYTTNITSTNVVSTNLSSSSLQVSNANILTGTISTLINTNAVSTNISSSTLTLSTGMTSASVQTTNLNATTATVATLINTNAVSTNTSSGTLNLSTGMTSASVQTTNLNATTATVATLINTNAVSTNISSSTLTLSTGMTSASVQTTNLNATTATVATLINTNAVSNNISSGTLNLSTGVTSASIQATNLNATNTTLGTFVASSGTVGGNLVPSTNITYDLGSSSLRWRDLYLSGNTIYLGDKTLSVANDTFNIANVAATNANLITSSIGTLVNTNTATTNVSSSTLTLSTGLTSASAQITNLNATTGTVGTLINTNTVTTNVSSSTLTLSTGLTSASAQLTNLNVTTGTVGTLLNTNTVTTNVSSSTLTLSTGLTSASAQITNLNVTTGTVGTLLNTNTITTNVSSGTLNLSTGLTSATAQITNLNVTTGTVGTLINTNTVTTNISTNTLLSSTIASNIVSSTTFTGANMSLSGNLNVAGTLTTVNITSTNLVNTNVSAGIVVATTSLSATGNSNTIGNIFTTGGNVGVGISSPEGRLNVGGDLTISNSTAKITFNNQINSGSYGYIQHDNSNFIINSINAAPITLYTNNLERMRVNTSGNVGIGTTSPIFTLDVTGTIDASTYITSGALYSTNQTTTNIVTTNLNATTGTVGTLLNTNTVTTNVSSGTLNLSSGLTSASIQVTNLNATTGTIGTSRVTTSLLAIGNSNTLGNIFTTNGNVGIGTTNPVYLLDVNGSTRLYSSVNNSQLYLSNNSGTMSNFSMFSNGPGQIYTYWDGYYNSSNISTNTSSNVIVYKNSDKFVVAHQSNVAIGSQFNSWTTDICVHTTSASTFVGIGTLTPSNTLDVTGTIRATTSLTTGALYSTNLTSTNIGGTTMTVTNTIFTNISSGTLNLSTGLTSASIQVTNLNATTETVGTSRVTTSLLAIGNSNTLGNIFTTGGNVGIATTSPITTLDINGNMRASGPGGTGTNGSALITGGDSYGHSLYIASSSGTQKRIGFNHNGTVGNIWSYDYGGLAAQNLILQYAGGNVGIATTSPANTLDVTGTGRITTSLTTGALYSTNLTSTNISGTTMTVTNTIFTNISSGTLNLSTGLTSASIQVTNLNATTETVGTSRVTTSLLAIGNSNTLGNIFTTGGNVGIGTGSPATDVHINKSNYAGIQLGNNDASGWTFAKETNGLLAFYSGAFGGGTFRFGSTSAGNFGIGTASPSYKLHVIGDIYASGDITAYSDARLKTNIKTIDSALDKVEKLRGVYYTHIETQKDSVGLIAQETLDVLPEVVATKGEYLGINYGNIVGLLVEAIKELRQEIRTLKSI